MSERKTEPVRATFIEDWEEFQEGRMPGAVHLRGDPLWYTCPCGCTANGALRVGNGFKPSEQPSWAWNGSLEAPELSPSVHHVGHWHGWLQNGVWRSV